MNKLGHLPSELISLVLGHVNKNDLYACTLVNKSFYKEAMPLLWRELVIDSYYTLTNISLTLTASPGPVGIHVRSVSISPTVCDSDFMTLIQQVPFLEHLQLGLASAITDTSFQHVARCCPHLITLDIYSGHMTLASMESLAELPLQVLRLTLLPYLNYAELLTALVPRCPLKKIEIKPCYNSAHGVNDVDPQAIALALAGFSELTSLRIQNDMNDYTPFFTTVAARGIVWPQLADLGVDGCKELDDSLAIAFIQAHPKLRHVELNDSDSITNATLDAMGTYLPDLARVDVLFNPELTAAGIYRLVKNCAALTADGGVHCYGCRIYPEDLDFPANLARASYQLDTDEVIRHQVAWFSGDAFEDDGGYSNEDDDDDDFEYEYDTEDEDDTEDENDAQDEDDAQKDECNSNDDKESDNNDSLCDNGHRRTNGGKLDSSCTRQLHCDAPFGGLFLL